MNYTITNTYSATFKVKRSEFIGYSNPINRVQDVNGQLKILRSRYPKARHICWAYRILSDDSIIENFSDAGEPAGSAGKPILNSIKQNNLLNCAVIIVRIFGGIKLGKPGLILAYKTTAILVIADSALIEYIPKDKYNINASVNHFGQISYAIKQNNGKILQDQTKELLNLLIELPTKNYEKFKMDFDQITHQLGKIKKAE